MIKDFKSKTARDILDGIHSRHARSIPKELYPKIQRLFDQLNAATQIETLAKPPGNQLEKLIGELKEYWSIRVNRQWRLIFQWSEGDVYQVDVIDSH